VCVCVTFFRLKVGMQTSIGNANTVPLPGSSRALSALLECTRRACAPNNFPSDEIEGDCVWPLLVPPPPPPPPPSPPPPPLRLSTNCRYTALDITNTHTQAHIDYTLQTGTFAGGRVERGPVARPLKLFPSYCLARTCVLQIYCILARPCVYTFIRRGRWK